MCNLLEALDYEQEDIVLNAFIERYEVSPEEAKEIFNETKKWLWLAAYGPETEEEALFIDTPLSIIDEMWHNFLLHSKLYYEYCMKKFNRLIHHIPSSHKDKEKYKESSIKRELMTKRQYSIIYDHLGSTTLLKWYDTMANKYTPEYIQSIKKF